MGFPIMVSYLEKEPIMKNSNDLKEALDEVSASSAGGAPFLISYGATFLITGISPSSCPARQSPLSPCSRAPPLSRQPSGWSVRLGPRRMSADNPLRPLSGLMAMSQMLGLPLLILVYSLNPGGIPLALAALGGYISYLTPGCTARGSTPSSPLWSPWAPLPSRRCLARRPSPTCCCL